MPAPALDPDDERLAHLVRAIRRRTGLRQAELARMAGVPRVDVVAIEAGHARDVRLGRLRDVLRAVDGRIRLEPWWRGAAADRLLDERHSALVEHVVRVLNARGWTAAIEVTFSEFGERGSIDVIGAREEFGAILVVEVKGSIGAFEELLRRLDVKARLAPRIAAARFGWAPRVVGRVLVVPEDSTIRRIAARHAATLASTNPATSREVRHWLRRPTTPISGLWFLSDVADADRVRRSASQVSPQVAGRDD